MQRTKKIECISTESTTRAIGIAAVSSFFDKKRLERGLKRFSQWGYPVHVDDRIHERHRGLAGSDASRAAVLLSLLRDKNIGTVWCARGGFGATRLLKMLDEAGAPGLLKRDPKLLFGYSDVTALHLYWHKRAGLPSFHSPMPAGTAWQKLPSRVDKQLQLALRGELPIGRESYTHAWNTKVLQGGKNVAGVLLGGNLTLLMNLIGTPWMPDLRGKILFLEDIAEAPYRVDRMLTHLENAGALAGLKAVLLGDFDADVVFETPAERKYTKEIFRERFKKIPVIYNLPVGHGEKNEVLPLGVRVGVSSSGRITLLEQPVGTN
jgi:muramoyltetrapeptide carboxypeptidase